MNKDSKYTKAEVRYTDAGTDAEHCSICVHYESPTRCGIVAGRIRSGGWCRKFKKE